MLALSIPALLLVVLASPVAPMERDELVLRTIHGDDGIVFKLAITPEQAEPVPAWNPDEGHAPPLDMDLAIKLARDTVKLRHPKFEEFRTWQITMASIGWGYNDRWFYIVKFRAFDDGVPVYASGFFAGVLMDGTVIDPVREPPPSGPKMN
jgi:hypothetical protein